MLLVPHATLVHSMAQATLVRHGNGTCHASVYGTVNNAGPVAQQTEGARNCNAIVSHTAWK